MFFDVPHGRHDYGQLLAGNHEHGSQRFRVDCYDRRPMPQSERGKVDGCNRRDNSGHYAACGAQRDKGSLLMLVAGQRGRHVAYAIDRVWHIDHLHWHACADWHNSSCDGNVFHYRQRRRHRDASQPGPVPGERRHFDDHRRARICDVCAAVEIQGEADANPHSAA